MPLAIIADDLLNLEVDAIIHVADRDFAEEEERVRRLDLAAGPDLMPALRKAGLPGPGQAVITDGYHLPAAQVIHVSPSLRGPGRQAEARLTQAYRQAFLLAREYNCKQVALPLLAAGTPCMTAGFLSTVAIRQISLFLQEHEVDLYLVLEQEDQLRLSDEQHASIKRYLQTNCRINPPGLRVVEPGSQLRASSRGRRRSVPGAGSGPGRPASSPLIPLPQEGRSESFHESLLRRIDERGFADARAYRAANVSRDHFERIRNNPYYRPEKELALAFAVSLRLRPEETVNFLKCAGLNLDEYSMLDMITYYFISGGRFDVFEINRALQVFGQPQLGCPKAVPRRSMGF